jgi:multidrug efflux pump subunit AcrA (membrane-fusion protein)
MQAMAPVLMMMFSVLVPSKVWFAPDQPLKEPPTGARIVTLSDETKPIEAQFLGPAPSVDPQVQGRGFLFLISPNPSRLAPGAAVTGYINVPGQPQSGVAVPRNAIVRFNGTAWVYVQTADDTFERTEARLECPMQDSWFVREGLKPNAKVVTTGAQQLLSEELKGQEE